MPTNQQKQDQLQHLVSCASHTQVKRRPHFDPWVEVAWENEHQAWEAARILDRDELEEYWHEGLEKYLYVVRIGYNTAEVWDLESIIIMLIEEGEK